MGSLSISGVSLGLSSVGSFPSWLSAQVAGPSSVTLSVNGTPAPPGTYTGNLILSSNAANSSVAIPIRVNVVAASGPLLSVGGIVDNAALNRLAGRLGNHCRRIREPVIPVRPDLRQYRAAADRAGRRADPDQRHSGPALLCGCQPGRHSIPFGMTAGQMIVQAVSVADNPVT